MAAKKRATKKKDAPFEAVYAWVRRIPRGRVATYGQISQLIDRRLTPVGVGWALAACRDETLPWQRVVNARGGTSTDNREPGLQRAMLEAEGVTFDGDCVDLARHQYRPVKKRAVKKPAKKR